MLVGRRGRGIGVRGTPPVVATPVSSGDGGQYEKRGHQCSLIMPSGEKVVSIGTIITATRAGGGKDVLVGHKGTTHQVSGSPISHNQNNFVIPCGGADPKDDDPHVRASSRSLLIKAATREFSEETGVQLNYDLYTKELTLNVQAGGTPVPVPIISRHLHVVQDRTGRNVMAGAYLEIEVNNAALVQLAQEIRDNIGKKAMNFPDDELDGAEIKQAVDAQKIFNAQGNGSDWFEAATIQAAALGGTAMPPKLTVVSSEVTTLYEEESLTLRELSY